MNAEGTIAIKVYSYVTYITSDYSKNKFGTWKYYDRNGIVIKKEYQRSYDQNSDQGN